MSILRSLGKRDAQVCGVLSVHYHFPKSPLPAWPHGGGRQEPPGDQETHRIAEPEGPQPPGLTAPQSCPGPGFSHEGHGKFHSVPVFISVSVICSQTPFLTI